MKASLIKFYLTAFGLGYSPIGPGTAGSIGAMAYIYFFRHSTLNFHFSTFILFTGLSYFLLVFADKQKILTLNDPGWVVQDEVSGLYLTYLLYRLFFQHSELDLLTIGIIFISFRLFDILKPWPVSYFDRSHHVPNIMHDDIFAGIYAGITTIILLKIIS